MLCPAFWTFYLLKGIKTWWIYNNPALYLFACNIMAYISRFNGIFVWNILAHLLSPPPKRSSKRRRMGFKIYATILQWSPFWLWRNGVIRAGVLLRMYISQLLIAHTYHVFHSMSLSPKGRKFPLLPTLSSHHTFFWRKENECNAIWRFVEWNCYTSTIWK